ncbi:fimbria/pilus periplasmic chaperone [Vibrio sp. 99-70-13A1]|uniref:fimbria/pilus periplasmic chaperone n=1 Tax=Vibrio sp. 99-70-13A1 TaxID=2607601 RepID=UPI001493AC4E|nr:fimbria/pilus periplasmic chaperone [Vibrio sp. 99-70-13A1]NOH95812.1 molecular chaperone [Vibrio sp. 99-70-13A1]
MRMRSVIFFSVLMILMGARAHAIVINPMVTEMDVLSGGMAQIVLTNNSTQQAPIEVNLRQLAFNPDGTFLAKDSADKRLMVFPPAAILKPGKSQVFRLQWLGDNQPLNRSQSYFLRFSQPSLVPSQGDLSGIAVQIHYNAIIHVYSSAHKPNVTLQVRDDSSVVVANKGERYAYLNSLTFISEQGNSTIKPLQSQVSSVAGESPYFDEHFLPPSSFIELGNNEKLEPGEYQGYEM